MPPEAVPARTLRFSLSGQLSCASGPLDMQLDGEIGAGEIVVLSGESGCGKTTLLRALAGLPSRLDGEVCWGEESWRSVQQRTFLPVNQRPLGMVFQQYALFPHMSVRRQLEFADPTSKLIDDFLAVTGLAGLHRVYPGRLSGGQQQRLALARALVRRPALLLLDEPTLGLAPVLVEALFETLTKLNAAGKTMLLVEQNAWHALQIAQRGYVLQTGMIELEGPAKELAVNPSVQESYLGGG